MTVTIELPADLAGLVQRVAAENGMPVPAAIVDILGAHARRLHGAEAMRWFEEEEGRLTPEELVDAERIWQVAEDHARRIRRAVD